MEANLSNIEAALHQMYNDANSREAADKWLNSIQCSAMAWKYSWELLAPEKPLEVQFFGACSLHTKILKFWHELPEHLYAGLVDKLLAILLRLDNASNVVVNKLCLAIAGVILHTVDDQNSHPTQELISNFNRMQSQPQSDLLKMLLLLEVLKGVPDEFPSAAFSGKSSRRNLVKEHLLRDFQESVRPFLVTALASTMPALVQNAALRCARSWIQFAVTLPDLGELVDRAFEALRSEELWEESVEMLLSAFSCNDAHRYSSHVERYMPHLLGLVPLWQKACETQALEVCSELSRLITTVAETHVRLIMECAASDNAERRLNAFALVDMVLAVTGIEGQFSLDENVSDLAFGFWYILQDTILYADSDKSEAYATLFCPVYSNLVRILLRKARYPDEQTLTSMTEEEQESFRCYREDISDTLPYAYCILGNPLLSELAAYLRHLIEGKIEVWQEVEVALFVVASLSESVGSSKTFDSEGNVWLPQIFGLLQRVQFCNAVVVNTTLHLVGAYADWLYMHGGAELPIVVPLLLNFLSSEETGAAATIALKEVARANLEYLESFAVDILNASKRALVERRLKARDRVRLMSCVGFVLSALPFASICAWLDVLLTPELAQLDQAASACTGVARVPDNQLRHNILDKLQSLTSLFSSLDLKRSDSVPPSTDVLQPVLVIVQKILPTLQLLFATWTTDEAIVESICELLKRSLMTLLDDFSVVLDDVCKLCADLYQAVPHVVVFDLLKQFVVLFGSSEQHFPTVARLMCVVSARTLRVLAGDLRNQTDLLASFMGLLVQVVKKCPRILAEPNIELEGLFQAGVLGISLPEHPTVKASCSFLSEVIAKKAAYAHMDAIVDRHALHLIDSILRAVAGASPRGNVENMSDVVLALNQQYFDSTSRCLLQLMGQTGYPLPSIIASHKDRFVKDILREVNNKKRLKATFVEFTLLCRGLSGSEYALQTST